MAVALLLATSLAAAPTYSVAVTRRVGLDAEKGRALAGQLAAALDDIGGKRAGVLRPFDSDATACNGAPGCVARLAQQAGLDRIVSLQLVKLGANVIVDASVVDAREHVLAAVTATIQVDQGEAWVGIAAQLAAKLPVPEVEPEPPPPPRPPDGVLSEPPPPPAPPAPVPAVAQPDATRERLRTASFRLMAATGVTSALGLVLLIVSFAAPAADFRPTGAYVCFGIGGALAVASTLTFVFSMP